MRPEIMMTQNKALIAIKLVRQALSAKEQPVFDNQVVDLLTDYGNLANRLVQKALENVQNNDPTSNSEQIASPSLSPELSLVNKFQADLPTAYTDYVFEYAIANAQRSIDKTFNLATN